MKLITEHCEDIQYLTEEKNGKKNFFIEGIFMQAEVENRNKRIYPKSVLESAVDKYVTEQVNTGRAVGELNHPSGPTINLDKVSHKITKLEWNGNNVIGKAQILNTPMGQIAQGLLEADVQLGVSTRGMGSLTEKSNKRYVKDDFMLTTVDIVQDPSAQEAFVNGIMEGVEFIITEDGIIEEKIDEMRNTLRNTPSSQFVEKQLEEWTNFINFIKG
jgi:predicted nucleotidyltransferase